MKFALTFILSFFALSIVGQGPYKISVQSCDNPAANGTYTKGIPAPSHNDCGCYDQDGVNARIHYEANGHFVYVAGMNCNGNKASSASKSNIIKQNADCNNILSGTSPNSCLVLDVSAVPSLSQWGIMILGLLMVVFGIVAVRNPRQVTH